ncbi:transglycosylase SLT domain-containing protein [Streptomyces sp. NPDC018031]|uniref:transglycosylase SLT domain-containing protein n=1 Tax=Streptomyces sp. NPDC018031 TaxID=3365033 RepID=UPI00378E869F
MRIPSISGYSRLTKTHKFSAAGIAAAGAAALAFTVVPGGSAEAEPQSQALSAKPVATLDDSALGAKIQKDSLTQQSAMTAKKAEAEKQAAAKAEAEKAADAAAKKAADEAAKKKAAEAAAKAKAERDRVVKEQVAKKRAAAEAANRSQERKPVTKAAPVAKPAPAKPTYPDNLDGWIRESLAIMKEKGIPGTYEGIHRNIIRESSGNPRAINNWDINAINGIPSKGLLQVIPPTFKAYHVEGTSWDIYDPVANITAACNYAADRYGSMDNVNSAY